MNHQKAATAYGRRLLCGAHLPLCLAACLAGAGIGLCSGNEQSQRVEEIFLGSCKRNAPGVAVAVIQHGQKVFEKGYGLANLEYDIPVGSETVYHVASVSKQFTAMALVLLEQDGKLSLEHDLHTYLPELPDYGQRVTIRQLLQHTSGIRDQWQTLALAGWRLDDVITQDQILQVLFRQKQLNFPPGTRYMYSNGGYTLAAEIVTRVAGKPFPEFCQERIFEPLGMAHTHFHKDHRRIVPNRAYSYGASGDGFEALPLNYANVGATSLFTTASDLVLWLDNFRDPKVGGLEAIKKLQEQATLASGEKLEVSANVPKLDYALGLAIGKYKGLGTVSHGGSDAGYRSFVVWFPEQELGISVLSGLASFDTAKVAYQVAEVFLGDKLAAEPLKPRPQDGSTEPHREFITLNSQILTQYVGHYKLDAGIETDIKLMNGKLVGEVPGQGSQELLPLATNRFFIPQIKGEVEFTKIANGGLRMKVQHDGATLAGERAGSETSESCDLAEYQGTYWSEELETQYAFVVKDNKLEAKHIRHGKIPLTLRSRDRFTTTEWFMPEVRFQRDRSNHVCGVVLGGGRVTGISFVRK